MVQLGELVDKASLTSMFDIEPGYDLQSDINELDKASALPGLLVHSVEGHLKI